jgi:hypothetical protein
MSSDGLFSSTGGIRKSDSEPKNQRVTTTLDTAESTTEPRMPALQRPMDFFDDEEHGRDGRVERSRQSGGRPYRCDQTHPVTRQVQPPAERRSDAGTDLQRGVFRAERVS